MSFSEVTRHVIWTGKLEQKLRPADDAD
jgi:hypothetical protein